jgi:CRISPR-associated endonuclease/helicase Cas3
VRDQLAQWIKENGTDAHLLLRIGRTRPLDREAQQAANERLMSGRERDDEAPITFVVATQSIEVGADLDLDALVTQAAPLDSLRQRFGRLDRLGQRGVSPAVVVAPKEDQKQPDKADDPVYGSATAATRQWLHAQANDKIIDFGIDQLTLPDAETLETLIAPRQPAPLLFPAYVGKWRKTSPPPAAEPEPRLFLHGPDSAPADVTLVWRADLPEQSLTNDLAQAVLAQLPPTAPEGLSVPVGTARAWLTRRTAPLADVEGARPDQTEGNKETAFGCSPVRWSAGEAAVITPEQIRPGDTLVAPAAWGGCDNDGWAPDSDGVVADLAETAALRQRGRLVLRLTRARLEAVGTDLWPLDREAAWAEITRVLDDPPADRGDLLATLRSIEPLPVFWKQRLDMLAASRVGLDPPVYPYKKTGAVLSAKRRLTGDQLRELGVLDPEDAADLPATEHDTGALTGAVSLADHSIAVASTARELAEKSGYDAAIAADVALAGRLHDLGKAEARFQILLHGGDELAAVAGAPRAKGDPLPTEALAEARSTSGLPAGTRHEAWSVALAERHPDLAQAHDADLVCWLVGTHHGHGRPTFPATVDTAEGEIDVADPETAANLTAPIQHRLERLDSGWSGRLRRLEARYGVWGLAHLEAVLRLADHRVSEGVLPRHGGAP